MKFAKTRLQLHSGPSKFPRNPFHIVLQVYHQEGLRALYKEGCGILIIGSIGKDAVRFSSFDSIKNAFRYPETGVLSSGRNMLAGMAAGVTPVFSQSHLPSGLKLHLSMMRGPRGNILPQFIVCVLLSETMDL